MGVVVEPRRLVPLVELDVVEPFVAPVVPLTRPFKVVVPVPVVLATAEPSLEKLEPAG
jgi:hypothetical protein